MRSISILIQQVKARGAKSFSLIEVVLALGVISFALVAILGVFPIGLAANRSSISDTRAAQLINAIVATIDAQCGTFSNVQCFGLPSLDLTTLTTTDAPKMLYASYPSPDQPTISNTEDANSIYTIELKFDNDPEVAPNPPPNGTHLEPGKLNQIRIRIRGKSAAAGYLEFSYLARKRN